MQEFENFLSLPAPLKARLERQLQSGEQLAWAGQPNEREYQQHQGKVQILGIVWLAFTFIIAIAGFSGRMSGTGIIPPPYGFYFIVALFLVISLYLISIAFWSRFFARRTLFVITNKRVI